MVEQQRLLFEEWVEALKNFLPSVVMIGGGVLAAYMLPKNYKLISLIPIGLGIYNLVKPFIVPPTPVEPSSEDERYEMRVNYPSPGQDVGCFLPKDFRIFVYNPYDATKRLYIRGFFFHEPSQRGYLSNWLRVNVKPGENTILQLINFNCLDNLGAWKFFYEAYWKLFDVYRSEYVVGRTETVNINVVLGV